jgi:hypothetical protein
MNLDQAGERAKRHFSENGRVQHGRKAMIEYESQALTTREKIATIENAPIS